MPALIELYQAQLRHAKHYADLIVEAQQLYGKDGDASLQGLELFDVERANIELGQKWSAENTEKCDVAANACSDYARQGITVLRLHPREYLRWQEKGLVAARQIKNRRAESAHLDNLGTAYNNIGKVRQAIEYYDQGLVIDREMGNRRGEAIALGHLGMVYSFLDEPRQAIEYYEQALVIHREMGNRRGEAIALGNLGTAYHSLGKIRQAIEYYEQALVIHRERGNRHAEATTLGNLGTVYYYLGDVRRMIEYHEQWLAINHKIGDRRGEWAALCNLGGVYVRMGKKDLAKKYWLEAQKISQELDVPMPVKVSGLLSLLALPSYFFIVLDLFGKLIHPVVFSLGLEPTIRRWLQNLKRRLRKKSESWG